LTTQRDEFLNILFERAKLNKNIVLLTVDMGAPALDKWRAELPEQFFSMGISEQNAINVAAGLRRGGKKVFVYFMAVWVLRCFEQIRYSCAMASNPITIIGNGVGLGYAPAGPAHQPNEDVAVMKSLIGVEIWSPSDIHTINKIVDECLNNDKLNYIRLERKIHPNCEKLTLNTELREISTINLGVKSSKNKISIFSYGFVLGRVLQAAENFISKKTSHEISIHILNKIYPLNIVKVFEILSDSKKVLTVEEQSFSGSISEMIGSILVQNERKYNYTSINLPNTYIFENGTRDYLLDSYGLSTLDIEKQIDKLNNLG